jgi:hypothetical protein
MRRYNHKWKFIFFPFAAAAFLTLAGFVVMNLWNYLLPVIFHVTAITFWQALGIFILCKILFGFGRGGRRFGGNGGGPWMRRKWEERFKDMSPDEREKFKERMRNCGRGRWDRHDRHPFESYWKDADKPKADNTEA